MDDDSMVQDVGKHLLEKLGLSSGDSGQEMKQEYGEDGFVGVLHEPGTLDALRQVLQLGGVPG